MVAAMLVLDISEELIQSLTKRLKGSDITSHVRLYALLLRNLKIGSSVKFPTPQDCTHAW